MIGFMRGLCLAIGVVLVLRGDRLDPLDVIVGGVLVALGLQGVLS